MAMKTARASLQRVEEIILPEGDVYRRYCAREDVIMAHHDTVVQSDDHAILFLSDAAPRGCRAAVPANLALGTARVLAVAHVLGLLLAFFGATYFCRSDADFHGRWTFAVFRHRSREYTARVADGGATTAGKRELKPETLPAGDLVWIASRVGNHPF